MAPIVMLTWPPPKIVDIVLIVVRAAHCNGTGCSADILKRNATIAGRKNRIIGSYKSTTFSEYKLRCFTPEEFMPSKVVAPAQVSINA